MDKLIVKRAKLDSAEHQPKLNLVHFSKKVWHLVNTNDCSLIN